MQQIIPILHPYNLKHTQNIKSDYTITQQVFTQWVFLKNEHIISILHPYNLKHTQNIKINDTVILQIFPKCVLLKNEENRLHITFL